MLYDVYRRNKATGHLERIARSLSKEKANERMTDERARDRIMGNPVYTYRKSPAEARSDLRV